MADKSGRRLLRRRLHRHQHRRHRLADYFGTGEAVAKLTKEAMEGGMKFEDALDARHRRDQSAGILRSRGTPASRSSAA